MGVRGCNWVSLFMKTSRLYMRQTFCVHQHLLYLHIRGVCCEEIAVWMLIISLSPDLWICENQISVVYNRWLTWWIWGGLTQAKSRRQVGRRECVPRGLKEHWHLSAEEIEWDVSEQQRLDRRRVLSKHRLQCFPRRTHTLSILQWPLGLKYRCDALLFAQGIHWGIMLDNTRDVLFPHLPRLH